MRKKFLLSSMLAICLCSAQAIGQDMDFSQFTDSDVIEKVREIASTTQLREVLSVEGTLTTTDRVFFLETLKFENGGILELTAGDSDRIFLMAKEVRLNGPDLKATIRYVDREPAHGSDAPPYASAPAQISGRSGSPNPGTAGKKGKKGEDGVTRQLPTLFIVADDLQTQTLPSDPFAYPDIRIDVDGLNGGNGGAGGIGQRGGKGQNGRHGETNLGVCSKGAKSGGRGGVGGDFGAGGVGGNGGNGGDIIFVVSGEFAEHVKDMRIVARGGLPGQGGINGVAGKGGKAGDRGSTPGNCGVSSEKGPGKNGKSAPVNSRANDGNQEGSRGRIRFVEYSDVAELFTLPQ